MLRTAPSIIPRVHQPLLGMLADAKAVSLVGLPAMNGFSQADFEMPKVGPLSVKTW